MDTQLSVSNPFMLMLQPEAVLAAVERSERLGSLRRRLCRPLDKPGFGSGVDAADAADAEGIDGAEAEAVEDAAAMADDFGH